MIPRQRLWQLRNELPIDRVLEELGVETKFREGYLRFLCPLCRDFNTATNPVRSSLEPLTGWPRTFGLVDGSEAGTSMGDLDGDGDLELVFAVGGWVHALDLEKTGPNPVRVEWANRSHDPLSGFSYHAGNLRRSMFLRGDADRDGEINVGDAIGLLQHLFLGVPSSCPPQLDVTGDFTLSLGDAMWLLGYLFQEGPSPAAPFPNCGLYLISSPLGECQEYARP